MPIHSFIHEASGETLDVYVPSSAPTSEHSQQERDGKVYKRVYSVPLTAANMGTRIGDATRDDFKRATTDKRGLKAGDAWEISAEMAAKRKQRHGCDPVREQVYTEFERQEGEKHPDVIQREKIAAANAKLVEMGIRLTL